MIMLRESRNSSYHLLIMKVEEDAPYSFSAATSRYQSNASNQEDNALKRSSSSLQSCFCKKYCNRKRGPKDTSTLQRGGCPLVVGAA